MVDIGHIMVDMADMVDMEDTVDTEAMVDTEEVGVVVTTAAGNKVLYPFTNYILTNIE